MKIILIPSIVAMLSVFSPVSVAEPSEAVQKVAVVKAVAPRYPESARRKGLVGYVLLEYVVDERGRAQDVVVLEAVPSNTFERSSVRALKSSKFEPTTIDGELVTVAGQRKIYVFDIDQPGATVAKRR